MEIRRTHSIDATTHTSTQDKIQHPTDHNPQHHKRAKTQHATITTKNPPHHKFIHNNPHLHNNRKLFRPFPPKHKANNPPLPYTKTPKTAQSYPSSQHTHHDSSTTIPKHELENPPHTPTDAIDQTLSDPHTQISTIPPNTTTPLPPHQTIPTPNPSPITTNPHHQIPHTQSPTRTDPLNINPFANTPTHTHQPHPLAHLIDALTGTDQHVKALIQSLPNDWAANNDKGALVTKAQLLHCSWGEFTESYSLQ